ncbi:hypothetical protein DL96DRAFT_1689001 [Flagelloscypha sp. PMI_526]|nr:hypothetical protein DL96DRAFT_1689001 [Flagelloscypha sp. PMI_526]
MSNFPLDLWDEILGSLSTYYLKSCSLVNRDWHDISQHYRFKHLELDSKTWKAKTTFLLNDANRDLRRSVRTLTINLNGIDSRSFDREVAGAFEDLYSLMSVIGQQLTTFQMEGPFYDEDNEPHAINWENLSPYFLSHLFTHIIPFVRSLEFVEVVRVPLLQILDKAPHLRSIFSSSDLDLVAGGWDADVHVTVAPAAEFDLSFGIFSVEDLNVNNSVGRFLSQFGDHVSSLEFYTPYTRFFIPNLSFLDPFDNLKDHLKHMTFGRLMFDTIIELKDDAEPLPLHWFAKLETLTFFIANPQEQSDWINWFNWVADSVEDVAKSFIELRFSIAVDNGTRTWNDQAIPSHAFQFNLIAPSSPFNIDFVTSWTNGVEVNENMFAFIRRWLLPWEELGKLNFWVNLEV